MRVSKKNGQAGSETKKVDGVDFHNTFHWQETGPIYSMSSEFGLSIGEVRRMKNYFQKR